ncbi:TfuA-like protein [Streptomyces sp. NPDC060209]|uniref:TfuA-like protein n=1 Tax=Streptomyces sp. NPDC060209 TaxID=3347073 RepID=UPI003664D175
MIHVFVGPTLARSEPQLSAPGIRLWPPARHGDLFHATIRDGDTAVLIDGVYHQAPALRHKEILAAMARGVHVIGAASIGALRAAELAPYGMLGVGTVYAAYQRGDITADDEVAVGQAPDGQWDALTWPLVNLRSVLRLAQDAGILDSARAHELLEALRAVYYPQRTGAAVRAVCRWQGESSFARWLAEQIDRDPHFGDVKRADALAAVRTARAGRAPRPGDRLSRQVWETTYFRRWSNAFAHDRVDGRNLRTEDRLVYQQVFDPAYRKTWAAYLEHRSLRPAHGPGLPLTVRLAQAAGNTLPADRVFHPSIDLRDKQTLALLLAGETPQDRQAVARYAKALEQASTTRPGFSTAAVRDGLTRQLLLRAWKCPEQYFDAEASARGLVCGSHAVAAAKRLVPGLLDEMNESTAKKETAGER